MLLEYLMSKIIWLLFLKPMVVNDFKGREYGVINVQDMQHPCSDYLNLGGNVIQVHRGNNASLCVLLWP